MPRGERRPDRAREVIGARGVEQERLRQGGVRRGCGIEDDRAHALGEGEPPGSRVSTTSSPRAFSASTSSRAWVDLPEPSPPSNVMNLPAVMRRAPAATRGPGSLPVRSPAD